MFLSNRGLYIPAPQMGEGFLPLHRCRYRYRRHHRIISLQQNASDQNRPATSDWPTALALIVLLPVISQWMFGAALHWDIPALRGFNFRGGMVLIPELAALTLALSVYTSAFIAEIIRAGIQAVPYGQHEAARSLGLPNPVTLRR